MSNDYPIKDKITYKNHIGCDLGTPDGKCIRFSDNRKHKPFITNIYKERLDKAIEYITSEESIDIFTTIESREQWLKLNKKLLNILRGEK